jgi:ribose transport system substrate-binding protein
MKRKLAMLLVAALAVSSLAACGGGSNDASSASSGSTTEESSAASTSEESSAASTSEESSAASTSETSESSESASTGETQFVSLEGQDIYVGFATGSSGTAWRDQGIREVTAALDEYKANGDIVGYDIVNNTTNGDANEQAEIIRNFIADDQVNLILVNPNDSTALNEAILDATEAGKLVVVADATVTAEGILNVTLDHYTYAYEPTEMLCEALGGKGTVIEISGLDGHPADATRIEATDDALANYPDINLAANQPGGWDQTVANQVAASILASGITPDGIITQDSEAYGILQACIDNGTIPKVMNGDSTRAYFELWKQLVDEGNDFTAIVAPNPPGIQVTALHIAMNVAQGKTFKDGVLDGTTYYYAVADYYTQDNFEEGWEAVQDLSDEEQLDEWLTPEEAAALFN